MKFLEELERRRDKIQIQLREKHAELEAIDKIIAGVSREVSTNGNGHRGHTSARTARFAKSGLLDAVLLLAPEWIAPVEIRDAMIEGGYKHKAKYPLLGGVFSTCKRLAEDGRFEVRNTSGRLEYRRAREGQEQST